MPFIDEKGRVLGKINIIDLLVILFLFFLVPMFYFGYKIMTKKPPEGPPREFVVFEADYRVAKIKPEELKCIFSGDKELDEQGEVIGEIVSLGEIEPYQYQVDVGGGNKIIQESEDLKQAIARLRLKVERREDKFYYKHFLIEVGLPFEFKTKEIILTAVLHPESVERETIRRKAQKRLIEPFLEQVVDCRFIKLKPEEWQRILPGDKELDKQKEVIGEIVNLGEIEPYQYEINADGGRKVIRKSETLRQAAVRLRLKVERRENKMWYKNRPIEVGLPFEFKSGNVNLTAIPLREVEVREKIREETVDFSVILKDLDENVLKQIAIGDKESDQNGRFIAEILSLGKMENNTYECRLSSTTFVTAEDSSRKQLSARMRLRCLLEDHGTEGNQLYFKDTPIERNKPFLFKTADYRVSAVVTQTFDIPSVKEKHILLEVRFSGVIPEVAKIVQKGDAEKDVLGRIVAVISDVVSNNPSDVLGIKEGAFITLSHPFQRDILLALDVTCIEKEGVYYYKNYPVKMGNNIVFSAELYSLGGVIVGLQIR